MRGEGNGRGAASARRHRERSAPYLFFSVKSAPPRPPFLCLLRLSCLRLSFLSISLFFSPEPFLLGSPFSVPLEPPIPARRAVSLRLFLPSSSFSLFIDPPAHLLPLPFALRAADSVLPAFPLLVARWCLALPCSPSSAARRRPAPPPLSLGPHPLPSFASAPLRLRFRRRSIRNDGSRVWSALHGGAPRLLSLAGRCASSRRDSCWGRSAPRWRRDLASPRTLASRPLRFAIPSICKDAGECTKRAGRRRGIRATNAFGAAGSGRTSESLRRSAGARRRQRARDGRRLPRLPPPLPPAP